MNSIPDLRRATLAVCAPLTLLCSSLIASPQAEEPVTRDVQLGLATWESESGSTWHTYADSQTGYAQFIFGGQAAPAFEPTTDEDFEDLGRLAVESTAALHGVEVSTLEVERFTYLPLGLIGTTDKATVRFRQVVGGLRVEGGFVNTLFSSEGQLLSVQSTALPGLTGLSTVPALGAQRAQELALASFRDTVGVAAGQVSTPELLIAQHETGPKSREARLAWAVEARLDIPASQPEAYRILIDARSGEVLSSHNLVHNFDVGGTLLTNATPGNKPDQANNPEQALPMNHARVDGGAAGVVFTDASGNFNFPGVNGPLSITVRYEGSFANVDNQSGADYQLVTSISGTGNQVLMNPSSQVQITSQANSHRHIGLLRDWVRQVNPADGTADFTATSNVNIANTCNAYYDGSSVNFFNAGGGCPNTSYSGVVAHEMGHWLNQRYGTGNGPDGMGEGNADVFAMYLYNTSEMGEDFLGVNTGGLRTGTNTRPFCGDSNGGCYGEVHVDGEPWMGAAWKVYEELVAANGAAMADSISDALFLGWMNSFNQTQIRSVIETQWLTLDDDNGNIDDGTPHYNAIDTGFRRQSFPGFDLSLVQITGVTELADTLDEVGGYDVSANVVSLVGANITQVNLRYRVNGAAFFQSQQMAQLGGGLYSGSIPGQQSPSTVEYYVEGLDSLGNVVTFPQDAPNEALRFNVGVLQLVFSDDFESGELGWTHGTFGDTSNSQDDWQRGFPLGQAGDPSGPNSGTVAWGNDLAIGNFNGEYQANVHNFLRSPAIDCSSAIGTRLRYKRWLTVEEGIFDQARISVNGVEVWSNPLSGNLLDNGWVTHEVDISAVADGNPAVTLEWSLQSDGGLEFGGWTLDDVEVLYVAPVGGVCTAPMPYGPSKVNSSGVAATFGSTGLPSESAQNLVFNLDLGIANQPAVLFSGSAQASVPVFNGLRLVSFPVTREAVVQLNLLGAVNVPYTVPTGAAGTTRYFQMWYRDPMNADGTGVGLSNGLAVTFCD